MESKEELLEKGLAWQRLRNCHRYPARSVSVVKIRLPVIGHMAVTTEGHQVPRDHPKPAIHDHLKSGQKAEDSIA